jgi:hypothetical protein
MAGLVLPHALNTAGRQVDVEARAAQHLLSIAAERDALSVEPQAIEYDGTVSELRLLVRRTGSASTVARGTTADAWHPDPLLLPVVFTSGKLTQAWADGRPLPRNQWRVILAQDQARPSIVLQIETRSDRAGAPAADKAGAWQVALSAEASAATRAPVTSGQGFSAALGSRSIDLDASGKGEKPW